MVGTIPNQQELDACFERIQPYIHRTPVLTSQTLNRFSGAFCFFKCENFQRMGAFKMRGAANAILGLEEAVRQKGVTTHSSGNFAQALSLAAKSLGIPAYIVMPNTAPRIKQDAVKEYGGQVILSGPSLAERESKLAEVQTATGAAFLHPSNDRAVILGQGTAALELLQDYPELDFILSPVGGGGLLAGTALAARYYGRSTRVIGAEPAQADDAFRSLQAGKILMPDNPQTIADGLRTALGDQNFPIIQQTVERIILVEESEIIAAMRLIWERMKLVIEASSAVPVAALLKEKETFQGKKVGIILSGGNVDLNQLPFTQIHQP